MALKLEMQTYQILANNDEVCIPSLSSILLAVSIMYWTYFCMWCPCKNGKKYPCPSMNQKFVQLHLEVAKAGPLWHLTNNLASFPPSRSFLYFSCNKKRHFCIIFEQNSTILAVVISLGFYTLVGSRVIHGNLNSNLDIDIC